MNRIWINMEKRRYYRAVVQLDLFGDLTITRSWGSLDNNRGQVRTETINTYDQGKKIMGDIEKRRNYRGYISVRTPV
jgi:predicted DNA-binding WGR domain protein